MSQLLPAAGRNLAEAAAALTRWRSSKPLGARSPDVLWSQAVALASTHGVTKVARVVRLDYVRLKCRLLAEAGAGVPLPLGFVEMTLGLTPAGPNCFLALSDARGRALTLAWTRPVASEVAAAARSLREVAP
jgi:hypothetical protein